MIRAERTAGGVLRPAGESTMDLCIGIVYVCMQSEDPEYRLYLPFAQVQVYWNAFIYPRHTHIQVRMKYGVQAIYLASLEHFVKD